MHLEFCRAVLVSCGRIYLAKVPLIPFDTTDCLYRVSFVVKDLTMNLSSFILFNLGWNLKFWYNQSTS
jgi:hypothetical protein